MPGKSKTEAVSEKVVEISNAIPQLVEQSEFLTEQEKYALDLCKMKRALALANAEKALAQNEVAELTLNNLVLQLKFKYSLAGTDKITEHGEIVRMPQGVK